MDTIGQMDTILQSGRCTQGDWTYRGMRLLTASEDPVPRINLMMYPKIAVASGPPYVMAGSQAVPECGACGLDRPPASGRYGI